MAKKGMNETSDAQETDSEPRETMSDKNNQLGNVIKLLVGLIFMVGGVLSYMYWWQDLLVLIRGGLGAVLLLAGLLFLVMGWSDM